MLSLKRWRIPDAFPQTTTSQNQDRMGLSSILSNVLESLRLVLFIPSEKVCPIRNDRRCNPFFILRPKLDLYNSATTHGSMGAVTCVTAITFLPRIMVELSSPAPMEPPAPMDDLVPVRILRTGVRGEGHRSDFNGG